MRTIKLFLIFINFLIYLIIALCVHCLVTIIKPSLRWRLMSHFSCWLIRSIWSILGIQVKIEGCKELLKEKGNFFITRHVSYIDGLIMGGLVPAILVSKKEIRSWPIIGQVIAASGTIFVDRKHKNKIIDSVKQIETHLNKKINIVVFPEGTTTDGSVVEPFQAIFFRPPIVMNTDVVPIVISYESIDGIPLDAHNKDTLYWYGDMNFFDHFWKLLSLTRIKIKVKVYERISTQRFNNDSVSRNKLSQQCWQFINKVGDSDHKESKESFSVSCDNLAYEQASRQVKIKD